MFLWRNWSFQEENSPKDVENGDYAKLYHLVNICAYKVSTISFKIKEMVFVNFIYKLFNSTFGGCGYP